MSAKQASQSSLFDGPDAVAAPALVTVAGAKVALNPAQRAFNRLTEQVRRQREVLSAWEAYGVRYQQRVSAELQPALADLRAVQRRLVQRMDEALDQPVKGARLSRRHRDTLRCHIETVVDDMLADGPDPELEALYEKHSDIDSEERRNIEMELAQAMMSDVFGAHAVEGHDAKDVESLMRHVHAKMSAQAEAQERGREERAAARAAKHGRKTKADAAAERKAMAAREAGQAVREIYRKLASALHPDREVDEGERQRKTLLMQRTNQAYERNDLLELLSLQIEIEQIDADHLASVPQARLRHYNEVLRDQLKALETQALECAAPILFELGLPPHVIDTRAADAGLSQRGALTRKAVKHIERDLRAFDDPRELRALLEALAQDDDEDLDPFEAALLDALMGHEPTPPQRAARARQRGKKRGGGAAAS